MRLPATFRDAVLVGNAHVGERDLRVMVEVGVVEERRRLRDVQPGPPRLDDEQSLLAVRDRQHEVEAGIALARDEPLLAVQHPLVLVALRRGRDRVDVRPAPGSVTAHASRY